MSSLETVTNTISGAYNNVVEGYLTLESEYATYTYEVCSNWADSYLPEVTLRNSMQGIGTTCRDLAERFLECETEFTNRFYAICSDIFSQVTNSSIPGDIYTYCSNGAATIATFANNIFAIFLGIPQQTLEALIATVNWTRAGISILSETATSGYLSCKELALEFFAIASDAFEVYRLLLPTDTFKAAVKSFIGSYAISVILSSNTTVGLIEGTFGAIASIIDAAITPCFKYIFNDRENLNNQLTWYENIGKNVAVISLTSLTTSLAFGIQLNIEVAILISMFATVFFDIETVNLDRTNPYIMAGL